MKPTHCKAQCCEIGAYWRELADAEQAANAMLREHRDELQQLLDRLMLTLRERDKEIASLMKRKKPVSAQYAHRKPEPIRRRA